MSKEKKRMFQDLRAEACRYIARVTCAESKNNSQNQPSKELIEETPFARRYLGEALTDSFSQGSSSLPVIR